MKDYDFKIKIADLIKQSWAKDRLYFTKKFSTKIPQLSHEGISCTVDIIWLDEKTLWVTIKDCVAILDTSCDICGKNITKELRIKEESIKVFVWGSEELANDDTIVIEATGGIIDLHDHISDSILLQDDVVHKCEECENVESEEESKEESGSIVWKFSTNN